MGSIQNSVNQMIDSIGKMAATAKLSKVASAYTNEQQAKEAERLQEEKTVGSYKQALSNELSTYDSEKLSKLKSSDEFLDKANEEYLKTAERMRLQRETWRMYRDQFKKDSPEWAQAEAQGQDNKRANIAKFREELAGLYKNSDKRFGRPRKNKGGK